MSANRIHGEFLLTPLSPVHIGSGEILQGIDYTLRGSEFVVKDVRAFFEAHRDNPKFALDAVEAGLNIGDAYVRYRLPAFAEPRKDGQDPRRSGPPRKDQPLYTGGGPRGRRGKQDPQMAKFQREAERQFGPSQAPKEPARQEGRSAGEVREFIKDPFGQVFFPATSFKGAVRTALACHLAERAPDAFTRALREVGSRGTPNPRQAFQPVNRVFFGERAHEDLLKALLIQDSQPLAPEACLLLAQVKVMNVFRERFSEKPGVPIQAECLVPGTNSFRLPFHIDTFVLERDPALKKLLGGVGVELLTHPDGFAKALREHGAALAQYECGFYAGQGQASAQRFFQGIAASPDIHLPVGFGTGWHAKTVGRLLRDGDLQRFRDTFRMGRREADLFPKTRKWARCKVGDVPMGWLKVDIEWK